MKRTLILLCLLPLFSAAQLGYISTIAGNGTSGFSGDGGPATNAQMTEAVCTIVIDGAGNVYVSDKANGRVRRVNTSGIITTFAGGGSSTADGIPATNASINLNCTAVDMYGNVYIADGNRIRKVDAATGIINTIAGSATAGYSGDSGPATAATLHNPYGLCVDAAMNIYIGEEANAVVRKISAAGIISTYAGTGVSGYSGDGGAATVAKLKSPDGVWIDAAGNLYVADRYNYVIRKIDASGIISTFAGSGSSGYCGDGGPATAACFFEPSTVCSDVMGNVYVGDFHNGRIRKITPSGIISTIAGGGASGSEGIPATNAHLTDTWGVGIDGESNIYITDRSNYRIRKVNGIGSPVASSDSFSVYAGSMCSGTTFTIVPAHYSPSLYIKTWFGDATTETDTLSPASWCASFSHIYGSSGTYTIKTVLFNGILAIDSVSYDFTYQFCRTLPVGFYYDANSNCINDSGDHPGTLPLLVEVDSNGIAVDTISATSGIYYTVSGSVGDIYAFKVIATPAGFHITCPVGEIIYDTVATAITPVKYMGLQCNTGTTFDLSEHAVIPITGTNDQWANIYMQNQYCAPTAGTLTLHYSSKYAGYPYHINPPALSVSGHTIVWDLGSLSSTSATPAHVYYMLYSGGTALTVGDTVHSYFEITPETGDADTSNNHQIIIDTVKGGCDPNEMWVSPSSCIASGAAPATLKYTINFENTGNDTAHNISVYDTLSDNVNPMSMRIVMSSNEMYVSKLMDTVGHTILKFDFPHINLLDSSHYGKCDGAVIFTVDTKPGLTSGADIINRAGIYFDYNAVVMTNTVDNTIGCPGTLMVSNVEVHEPLIYPNPANNLLHIDKITTATNYRITDLLGTAVQQGILEKGNNSVAIQSLPQAIYMLELIDIEGNRTVRKVVKD